MEGETPFSLIQSKTPMEQSKFESPHKSKEKIEAKEGSQISQEGYYRLERMFEEAANREERYVTTIKEQEKKMKEQAEIYLESLRGIRKEFMRFMTEREAKTKDIWKFGGLERRAAIQQVASRPNTQAFTTRLPSSESEEPRLDCGIECYFYTPLLNDVMRETFPTDLTLTLRTVPPDKQLSVDLQIIREEEEEDNINCLIHHVPFQLLDSNQQAVKIEFPIHYQDSAISQFKHGQFQLQLIDKRGMFVYGEAHINLSSLLQYESKRSEWLLRPLPFYSPMDGRRLGQMSIKLFNEFKMVHKGGHHKVSSNQPAPVRSKVTYQDDESRMIQRISKFKSNTNSLLMGIGSQRRGRADEYFEKERDRMVIMHRQQKELESIQEYKESRKEEYMEKVFNEALEQFQLNPCPIGKPTFLTFSLQAQRPKLMLKTWAELKGSTKSGLEEYLSVAVVAPSQVDSLVKTDQLHLPPHSRLDYDYDSQQGSIWAVVGSQITVVVRVICFPPAPKLLTQLQPYYQVYLSISDEYGQEYEKQQNSIQLQQPQAQSHIHVHGYAQTESKIQIPFEGYGQATIAKNVVSNMSDLEYSWNESYDTLLVRFHHPAPGERRYHLVVNDSDHMQHVNSYQISLHTYPPLSSSLVLGLGQVRKIKLDFTPQPAKISQDGNGSQVQQVRVLFVSSRREHCMVKCQNESQLLCNVNKTYEIQCLVQSFSEDVKPQRIVVHAMDLDRSIILKRWVNRLINKEAPEYKHTYKLTCHRNKPLKYKFDLINPEMKDQSFKLCSSNLSLMTPPLKMVQLIGQQQTSLDLTFCVKTQSTSHDSYEYLTVVLTVTQGNIFTNYLYELTVQG